MIGLIIMAAILIVGTLALWYFTGIELPVAAVLILMGEIVVNVAGYYLFGWWGG